MKKLLALLVLAAFLLCSCRAENADTGGERFFDYQKGLRMVEGTFFEGAQEYGIKLYFKTKEGEAGVCRRVEYTSPETVKGLIFTLEGQKITAELAGVRINGSYFMYDSVFRMKEMFSLSEADILSIEKGENETTVATGKAGDDSWQVTTGRNGIPKMIVYESAEGSYKIKIDKVEFADQLC
ncbi:MAG: hypothetical protein IKL24_06365 [Clostridia bacterium]|nr:hypothetical protein [Clostridia bacterium]